MSSQGARRRCIIQKLDFENGIITNTKTTAKRRKKLRARITREIEEIPETPEEEQPSSSQASSQRSTSPVLIQKKCKEGGSPVVTKRKKGSCLTEEEEEESEKVSEQFTIEEVSSPPDSPVFRVNKKPKTSNPSQEVESVLGRVSSIDLFKSQGSSSPCIQIDEFTQESKPSVKISQAESSDVKNRSIQSEGAGSSRAPRDSSGEECRESPKRVRKRYKKHSLLGRLQKLQQKRASDKLLWQFLNRENPSTGLEFSIISFWKEEFYYFLKCRSNLPESETSFLVVDSRWVSNVKNVTEGSKVQLHPPWLQLQANESGMTVFLNVICLKVLEGTEEAEPVPEKREFESVPTDQFENDEKLFVQSLFSVGPTGFL